MSSQRPTARLWGQWVAAQLREAVGALDGLSVEVLAGQSYAEPLRGPLQRSGASLMEPMRGLRMGEQLAWLVAANAGFVEESDVEAERASEKENASDARHLTVLSGPDAGGSFEYRWPNELERCDTSWLLQVKRRGNVYSIRHCLGAKFVDGALRRHAATSVNGAPEVEGVAPDDYEHSGSLACASNGLDEKLVREPTAIPHPFDAFDPVHDGSEINAHYTGGCTCGQAQGGRR